jgi:hypothetical protein
MVEAAVVVVGTLAADGAVAAVDTAAVDGMAVVDTAVVDGMAVAWPTAAVVAITINLTNCKEQKLLSQEKTEGRFLTANSHLSALISED